MNRGPEGARHALSGLDAGGWHESTRLLTMTGGTEGLSLSGSRDRSRSQDSSVSAPGAENHWAGMQSRDPFACSHVSSSPLPPPLKRRTRHSTVLHSFPSRLKGRGTVAYGGGECLPAVAPPTGIAMPSGHDDENRRRSSREPGASGTVTPETPPSGGLENGDSLVNPGGNPVWSRAHRCDRSFSAVRSSGRPEDWLFQARCRTATVGFPTFGLPRETPDLTLFFCRQGEGAKKRKELGAPIPSSHREPPGMSPRVWRAPTPTSQAENSNSKSVFGNPPPTPPSVGEGVGDTKPRDCHVSSACLGVKSTHTRSSRP